MAVEIPAQQFFNELCSTDWNTGSISAVLMSSLAAATLTARAAQSAVDHASGDEEFQQMDLLLQASHSRREELVALFSKERQIAGDGSLTRMIFQDDVQPSSGNKAQKELRSAIDLPLTAIRVQLDGLKILQRLADLAPLSSACEVETSMNITLAGISSLRTIVELGLTRVQNRQMAEDIQTELRGIAETSESLTNDIISQVRSRIF